MQQWKASLASILCLTLCVPTLPAQSSPSAPAARPQAPAKPRRPYRSGQLQGDERILHALNRFTFGPRPGDLEAVKAEGLDRWFERQLHPATLDNSLLALKLAEFPAMQWSTEDLIYRLPSDAMIRQAADGKIAYPESGALHAVYVNQIDRYALRKAAKDEEKRQQASAAGNSLNRGALAATAAAGPQSGETQSGQMNEIAAAQKPELASFSQAQIEQLLLAPPARRLAQLATMREEEFDRLRKALKPAERTALATGLNPEQREVLAALENPKNLVNNEICEQRLTRDIYSNAQLQEVMTDFWLNHFNVFLHKNDETPYYLVSYERDVVRPRALGKFEDLLEATAHSPAMMLYLDNASSIGPQSIAAARAARNGRNKAQEGLNENYARELMELHTVGVNGGYTQKDVTQVARVFTGWGVERPARGGPFRYDPNRHQPGVKLVMGKKIKESGEREGEQVLHMLASSPSTAKFVSRKLAIRFVSDDPPQSLVDRMARTYMSSGGDISELLRTLFHSPEFWAADNYRAKVKTPIEFVVSSLRATPAQIGVQPDDLKPFVNVLQGMGMPLYGAVPPTGYNWEASSWVNAGALVNRMNFALMLASNKFGGLPTAWAEPSATRVSSDTQVESAAPIEIPSPEAEEHRLESLLIAGGVSETTRAAVLEQLQSLNVPGAEAANDTSHVAVVAKPVDPPRAAKDLERQDEMLAGLLLGSPEFQRR